MSFSGGRNTKVYINGYDLSAAFHNAQAQHQQGTYDVTAFGASSKAFINGLAEGTLSLDGFFEAGSGSIDAVLQASLGTEGVAMVFHNGDAIGSRGRACASLETSYQVTTPVDGVVGVAAAIQADGGLDAIVSLHALGAETTTGAAASVDNGAATTNGGVGYIEATAFSGTNATVKVQHSSDNSVWADLITFTDVAAANAKERRTVSGTVNRYLRANHSGGTFSSVTDVVGFARL